MSCDYKDFEKDAAPTWTTYRTTVHEIVWYISTHQEVGMTLAQGQGELLAADVNRKRRLEQIWAPFNAMWGYPPSQGSEFNDRQAGRHLPGKAVDTRTELKRGESSKGPAKDGEGRRKRSSKRSHESHSPSPSRRSSGRRRH